MSFLLKKYLLWLRRALPGHTLKTLVSEFQKDVKTGINPLKILAKLKLKIAPEFFKETASENAAQTSGLGKLYYLNTWWVSNQE